MTNLEFHCVTAIASHWRDMVVCFLNDQLYQVK